MKRVVIIGVWLMVLIVDGTVLPPLTGWPSGFGIMVLLSALAITFGIHLWVIGLGLVLAGMTELILGSYFGAIIGAWLIMAWIWYFLNRFLNMKPISENKSLVALVPFTLLGFILFVFGEGISWIINYFIYGSGFALTILVSIIRSPIICAVVVVELIITLSIFRLIYYPKDSIYG